MYDALMTFQKLLSIVTQSLLITFFKRVKFRNLQKKVNNNNNIKQFRL